MPSVQQALQTPIGSQVFGLGPVTVTAKWGAKQVGNFNKWMRNVTVTDGSGSVEITLWGAAAQLPIQNGQVGTFTGALKRGEYQGNPKLEGENGISFAADGNAPVQQHPAGNQSHGGGSSQTQGVSAKDQQIMRQNGLQHASRLVAAICPGQDIYTAANLTIEIADQFARFSETGEVPGQQQG